jgi:hypothetical protein
LINKSIFTLGKDDFLYFTAQMGGSVTHKLNIATKKKLRVLSSVDAGITSF